jgi:DNA-binding LacI/PurR family transcriptional regulator
MDNSVYFTPSLTEVVLPMRKMMLQTVYLIREQLSTHVLTKEHFVFDPYIVYRESFPA